MRSVTKTFALLGGLALTGLLSSQTAQAADIAPVVEEPAAFGWYVSLFGGPKWGHGDFDVKWERDEYLCEQSSIIICEVSIIAPVIEHLGHLNGEVDNGFIFGGTIGAQLNENFRAEIEVSHASLDTESHASEKLEGYLPTISAIDGGGPIYKNKDEGDLDELFILANLWFGFPLSSAFSPYFGGGIGVANVDADFGVGPFATNAVIGNDLSVKVKADDWALAFQLGAGLLIGLSEHFAIDLGYRFKAIHNVDLDDPEFCGGKYCYPPVEHVKADDEFDIHEHVAQIGILIGF
jgi:opacity protein-like surface antigen